MTSWDKVKVFFWNKVKVIAVMRNGIKVDFRNNRFQKSNTSLLTKSTTQLN